MSRPLEDWDEYEGRPDGLSEFWYPPLSPGQRAAVEAAEARLAAEQREREIECRRRILNAVSPMPN